MLCIIAFLAGAPRGPQGQDDGVPFKAHELTQGIYPDEILVGRQLSIAHSRLIWPVLTRHSGVSSPLIRKERENQQ